MAKKANIETHSDADIGDEMQDHDELMNLLPIEATSYDDVKVDELSDNFVERQTGNKKDINFSEDNEITDLLEPFSTTYTRKVKIDGKYDTVPNLIFHHDNSSKYKSDSSSTIVESKTLLDPVDRKSQQENLLEYATVPSSRNVLDTLEFSSSEYSFQQIVANGHSIHKTEKVENKIQSGCSQDEDEGFSVENDEISDIERTLDSNVDCTLKSDLKLLRRKISSNAVNESPDDYSNADQIVMAISYRCRKLGCAFFNFEKNRLYLMEDVEENSQFEIVKLLIYQIQPKIIICPTKIDEKLQLLINHVSKLSQRKEISATRLQKIDEYNELTFELRPTSEFSYINGKNRLMNLKIADKDYIETSKSTYEQIFNLENGNNFKLLYLESIVSMDKQEMVGSAGALLNYIRKLKLSGIMDKRQNIEESIKRKRARYGNLDEEDVDCEDGNENNFVEGIEQFTLKEVMHINADALCSLQVFETINHPNMHSYRNCKEGLSLFGILNSTCTSPGKQLLRNWFMRPSLDIKEINARQDCISLILYADKKEGGLLIQNLKGILRKLGNVEKVINNLKKKSSLKDFEFLSKFCLSCLRLKEFLEDLFEDVNLNSILILKNLIDSIFHKDVTDLCQKILQVVDFDESELNEDSRTVVKVGVDLELDAMKVKFHGLDEYLGKVAYQVSANLKLENPKSSLRVIYFPQLGYLIALPFQSDCDSFKDIQGLIFQFCTASTVYYKNDTMFELDESLGDLHSLIADREIEIIQTLQEKILPYSRLLTKISKHSAELDCILSFAEASKKYGYTRPKVTEENFLEIVEGRHPLQELCVASFIPNDVTLGYNNNGYGKPSGIVLTGPNFSGKSVYLKEIALIVFMSHIGSFVPAKQATIGLTDKIFTRVQTRESVSKMESAFMIDLHQVSVALRSCTRRSLVLFDEFGKGTQSSDGVGLFCATIEHLISKKKEAPKFLAATHFHEIFFLEKQILNFEENQIQKLTMDIYQEDADGLIFLYKVSPGIALSSWGLYCASLANIPDKIVQRGKEISILVSKGKDLRVDSVEGYYLKKLGKNCITAVENFCEQFFPSLFFKKKLECTEDDIKGNDTERLFSKLEQFENII